MFIGREKEINKLQELYNRDSAEFVAIYGRRRVGKTALIDHVFQEKYTFMHSGLSPLEYINSTDTKKQHRLKDQLEHFYNSLVRQGMQESVPPKSWLKAFSMLESFLSKQEEIGKRIVVFFDEIQWLDTPRSGFMTGLEAFWNGWACHKENMLFIVCGSSTSWILDKLINNHGGLYGRVTYQMKLRPFTLHECELFHNEKGNGFSRYDVTQAYMAVGGIPYYLQYFEKGYSIDQNLQAMFFDENAPLKYEFRRLFSSLFTNYEVMESIAKALSTLNRGLTRAELLKKTGLSDSGEISRYLESLINGAFVVKYYSFGNGRRESFYKLIDPFCIFYLKFVERSTDKLRSDWMSFSNSAAATSWKGFAFENVCFNHIPQIKFALGIAGVSTYESLWSKKGKDDIEGTPIDLIIERKDRIVNMCEIKFYSDEFTVTKDYHFILERRKRLIKENIPKRASVQNVLITTFGLRHVDHFSDFAHTITLDDLFRMI